MINGGGRRDYGRQGRNNRSQEKRSVNSNIAQFYNSELKENSTALVLRGWDNSLSISISLPDMQTVEDEYMKFDYNSSRIFSLTHELLVCLDIGIDKLETSLGKADNKYTSFAICGGRYLNKFLKIGYNGYDDFKDMYYVAIIEKDEKTGAEIDKVIHFFKSKKTNSTNNLIFYNYDEDSNKNKPRFIQSDWLAFKNLIKYYAETGILAGTHAANSAVFYKYEALRSNLDILNGKLDASFGRRGNGFDNERSYDNRRDNRSYNRRGLAAGRTYNDRDEGEDDYKPKKKKAKEKSVTSLDDIEEELS